MNTLRSRRAPLAQARRSGRPSSSGATSPAVKLVLRVRAPAMSAAPGDQGEVLDGARRRLLAVGEARGAELRLGLREQHLRAGGVLRQRDAELGGEARGQGGGEEGREGALIGPEDVGERDLLRVAVQPVLEQPVGEAAAAARRARREGAQEAGGELEGVREVGDRLGGEARQRRLARWRSSRGAARAARRATPGRDWPRPPPRRCPRRSEAMGCAPIFSSAREQSARAERAIGDSGAGSREGSPPPREGWGGSRARYSLARMRTTPVSSTSTAPWLIMVLTKCAARSPCQVMSVLISAAEAWPTAVRW